MSKDNLKKIQTTKKPYQKTPQPANFHGLNGLTITTTEDGKVIISLDKQSQEVFGKSELVIITERVDDVALLISQMLKDGIARCVGSKHSKTLEAKRSYLGIYSDNLASVYFIGGRPPKSVGRTVYQRHEKHIE